MTPRIGDRFGKWTVIGPVVTRGSAHQRRPHVLCRCRCGKRQHVIVTNLVHRRTTQCHRCADPGHVELMAVIHPPRRSNLVWLPDPTAQSCSPLQRVVWS
jgi:hypothetical protein